MKNHNTHRVFVLLADGRKQMKASGKIEFCNIVAASHRRNGYETVIEPIPESDLR